MRLHSDNVQDCVKLVYFFAQISTLNAKRTHVLHVFWHQMIYIQLSSSTILGGGIPVRNGGLVVTICGKQLEYATAELQIKLQIGLETCQYPPNPS